MSATRLVIYLDVFGGWRWEYHQPGGQVRDSRYSYDTRSDCRADARRRGLLQIPARESRLLQDIASRLRPRPKAPLRLPMELDGIGGASGPPTIARSMTAHILSTADSTATAR